MRKIAIFLTTITFFGCLALGIWLSERSPLVENLQSPSSPTEIPTPTELTHQTNIIFIHVDNLQSPRPALRSLWGFFISLQDPASVMIAPLLPFASEEVQAKLAGSFRLNENLTLESRFAETIRKELKLSFAEYILIDDTGLKLTEKWISEHASAPLDISLIQEETLQSIEQVFFTAVCETISPSQPIASPFIWNELLPDYAFTNLSLQNAMRIWATISDPEKPARCEVFYPNRTE